MERDGGKKWEFIKVKSIFLRVSGSADNRGQGSYLCLIPWACYSNICLLRVCGDQMFLTFAYGRGQTGRLGVFILTFVFVLKVSPHLSLVCQFCWYSFMLYPNKQVNHANGLARIWGREMFDVTWLLDRRIGRVETLALGGEAQSTPWSEHTITCKHLEQRPGPCLHLYLVMKELMPRCNQKLIKRVGPL